MSYRDNVSSALNNEISSRYPNFMNTEQKIKSSRRVKHVRLMKYVRRAQG